MIRKLIIKKEGGLFATLFLFTSEFLAWLELAAIGAGNKRLQT